MRESVRAPVAASVKEISIAAYPSPITFCLQVTYADCVFGRHTFTVGFTCQFTNRTFTEWAIQDFVESSRTLRRQGHISVTERYSRPPQGTSSVLKPRLRLLAGLSRPAPVRPSLDAELAACALEGHGGESECTCGVVEGVSGQVGEQGPGE